MATCGADPATHTQLRVVRQKTERSTMSSAEFSRIDLGMSLERVTRIVGNPGTAGVTVGATSWRFYDRMPFMKQAEIKYRRDRVAATFWNSGDGG